MSLISADQQLKPYGPRPAANDGILPRAPAIPSSGHPPKHEALTAPIADVRRALGSEPSSSQMRGVATKGLRSMHRSRMSEVVAMVSGMRTRWSGATGRYRAKCEQGHCALTGDQATSKLQGQIFTLLDYVIGSGHHDVRGFAGRRLVRLDMEFRLPSGQLLVVEYDGAYWHRNKEERDFLKARAIERAWRGGGCFVVRIREYPLMPSVPYDVQVPAGSDAARCTQLALLHFVMSCPTFSRTVTAREKTFGFLRSGQRALRRSDVMCSTCWKFAGYYLPVKVSDSRRRHGH